MPWPTTSSRMGSATDRPPSLKIFSMVVSEPLPRAITGAHSDLNERTLGFFQVAVSHTGPGYTGRMLLAWLTPLSSNLHLHPIVGHHPVTHRAWVAFHDWQPHG